MTIYFIMVILLSLFVLAGLVQQIRIFPISDVITKVLVIFLFIIDIFVLCASTLYLIF
jgi:hypothetical protein